MAGLDAIPLENHCIRTYIKAKLKVIQLIKINHIKVFQSTFITTTIVIVFGCKGHMTVTEKRFSEMIWLCYFVIACMLIKCLDSVLCCKIRQYFSDLIIR